MNWLKHKLRWPSRQTSAMFAVVFCFMAVVSGALTLSGMRDPVIRSDGKGYYLYLPSVFIHQDLTMAWTESMQQADPPGPRDWYGISKFGEDSYLNKYPIGMAIVWTPFFLLAHLATILSGGEADGFSFLYQVSVALAAAFFASLGFVLVYKVLRRYFAVQASLLASVAILLATNVFSYTVYDGAFTHIYSFALVAAILYLTPLWYANMNYRNSLLLAAIVALSVLVRQTNVLLIILVLLWNVTSLPGLLERVKLYWANRVKIALMALSGLLIILPQLAYYKLVTGSWLFFSYRGEGFDFLQPELIRILFSPERGALFWAPVLVLALVGLFFARKHLKEWAVAFYVFLPIWFYTMASWHSWRFGQGFGHRVFIDIMPLLALLIALFYSRLKSKLARISTVVAIVLLIFSNIFLSYHYWVANIRSDTTLDHYFKLWQYGLAEIVKQGLDSVVLVLVVWCAVLVGVLLAITKRRKITQT